MLRAVRKAENRLIGFVEELGGYPVFVSHDSGDEELARQIEEKAASVGVDVWLFEEDNHLGKPIRQKVQNAIDESNAFVVLFAENSSMSSYVRQEIGYAEGTDTPVLPMVHDSVDGGDLAMLRGREQIRFGSDQVTQAASELKQRIRHRRRKSARNTVRTVEVLGGLSLLASSATTRKRTRKRKQQPATKPEPTRPFPSKGRSASFRHPR
ncbi:hypothetical protein BRD56_08240 [Thermoplasmatales archaeon SW_10_69_26]|nr:MAG: hypothetical protein BRD56_08240 [Thermoplasmatales archaeon SW_10_69_26]